MELSYSLMILIEASVLILAFSLFLFFQRKSVTKPMTIGRRTMQAIAITIFAGAVLLFLLPKVNLLIAYDYTKLTVDAWDHFTVTEVWGKTGSIPTDVYPYYSNFPVTYAPQLALSFASGLSLFDSMTIFYLIVGLAGLGIIVGIANEIIVSPKNDKIIFAGISAVVYSFLQYFNLLFVQQYPLAIGTVAALLCIYAFVLLARKKKRSVIYIALAGIIIALSHPFAPILTSVLFLAYFLSSHTLMFKQNSYQLVVLRRIAVFMSLSLITTGLLYSIFVATDTFESGVRWSERNTKSTLEKLTSQFIESTTGGVGQTFERRYDTFDSIVYALNWAIPTSTSIAMFVFILSKKNRIENGDSLHLLFPLAIVSTLLFLLTFSFSFVEFAFSRYFGAFALTFNIPLTSYLIFKAIKTPIAIARYPILAIMGLAVISSVTDPTMLPNITIGDTVYRDSKIYPTEQEITVWGDFYLLAADQNRLVQSNVHSGPVKHYKETNQYQNEIVMNPKNFTLLNDESFLIIEKSKLDPASGILQHDLKMDRIYDNSRIYFGE
jgi:hypothetical protein